MHEVKVSGITNYVIFDFDGTIFNGDSFIVFAKKSVGVRHLLISICKNLHWLLFWKLGLCSSSKAKMKLFSSLYKGVKYSQFLEWGQMFIESITKYSFSTIKSLVSEHVNNGDKVFIISASMYEWISPWADSIGNITVIATKPEISPDGILTGRFNGSNCIGEEKINRFSVYRRMPPSIPVIVYTDSIKNDGPLISISELAYIVDRNGKPVLIKNSEIRQNENTDGRFREEIL